MTTANDAYDSQPVNFVRSNIKPLDLLSITVFAGFGPNTDAERLACAAVLHRNGADDLAEMVGVGYAVVGT